MGQSMNNDIVLKLRDEAIYHLEKIKTIEMGKDYINKVKGIEAWAKAQKLDVTMQNIAAEQNLRTQRILGRLIREGQENGEIASQKRGGANIANGVGSVDTVKTLSEIGITRDQSSTYQKIERIPKETFENLIAETKEVLNGKVSELTTSRMLKAIDEFNGKIPVEIFTGNNENYTPDNILDLVNKLYGQIDLDPASSDLAQKKVNAKTYYTIKDDSLNKKWFGKVFLNPPYSSKEISQFIEKLINSLNDIKEVILLTNNNTDTRWFLKAVENCNIALFTKGRINFYTKDIEKTSPTNGQTIFYFGHRKEDFKQIFSSVGYCMEFVK